MPDRDVFDRNVARGWQTAARRMVGAGDDLDGLPSVLRALGKVIKESGCPGFDEIVGSIADALRSPQPRSARRLAVMQLDSIRLREGNRVTEIAVASARQFLARGSESCALPLPLADGDQLHVDLATLFLADIADAYMCPAALLGEIIEGGEVSFQEIHSRRERAKRMIAAAPETRRLAAQLLGDPSGASVRTPRIPSMKLSQAEILVVALTK